MKDYMKSDLSGVKVGDKIFTIQMGWVSVEDISIYECVICNGPCGYSWRYYMDGKVSPNDKFPSAWTFNPFNQDDRPKYEPKKGEVVAVRDFESQPWNYDKFNDMTGAGRYRCSTLWEYARPLTPEERGE